MSADYLLWVTDSEAKEQMLTAEMVAASFSRLAHIKHSITPKDASSMSMRELARQADRLVERGEMGAREVATIFWAAAKLRVLAPWLQEMLLPALLERTQRVAGQMSPQGIANSMWSLGVLGERSPQSEGAIEELQKAAVGKLPDFTLRDVSGLLVGLAELGVGPDLVEALSVPLLHTLHTSRTIDGDKDERLPLIAANLVRLGIFKKEVFDRLACRMAPTLQTISVWGLSALVWAWTSPLAAEAGVPQGEADDEAAKIVSSGKGRNVRPQPWISSRFVSIIKSEAKRRGLTQEQIETLTWGNQEASEPGEAEANSEEVSFYEKQRLAQDLEAEASERVRPVRKNKADRSDGSGDAEWSPQNRGGAGTSAGAGAGAGAGQQKETRFSQAWASERGDKAPRPEQRAEAPIPRVRGWSPDGGDKAPRPGQRDEAPRPKVRGWSPNKGDAAAEENEPERGRPRGRGRSAQEDQARSPGGATEEGKEERPPFKGTFQVFKPRP